ncbi:hypothetical protein [Streptoalloteichus hindustanus]|nr:hypothetical protein [Streptoalloteichus hindustanus]
MRERGESRRGDPDRWTGRGGGRRVGTAWRTGVARVLARAVDVGGFR